MKKIIIIIVTFFLLIILIGAAAIINIFSAASVAASDALSQDSENICNYKSDHVDFNEETEKHRKYFENSLDEFYVNVAMALFQSEPKMSEQDVVDEIKSWNLNYNLQANIQDFKYDHKYIPYLKSIDERHTLSNSRRYYEDQYDKRDKGAYHYYLDVLSLINKDCMIEVNGEYTAPLKAPYVITQEYAVSHVYGSIHFGIDMVKEYGAPVYAPASGKIDKVGKDCPPNGGYLGNMCNLGQGNYVQIEFMDGERTIYVTTMHMKEVAVNVGDEVIAGQQIGTQGNSGNSTGSHVHIEFRKIPDVSTNIADFINPHTFINFF